LGLAGIGLAGRISIDKTEAAMMITFIWVIFAFSGILPLKIKIKKGSTFIAKYSFFLALKIVAAFLGALLLLSPTDENITHKALFYLFSYFIFLMFDIYIKTHDLNKKLDN